MKKMKDIPNIFIICCLAIIFWNIGVHANNISTPQMINIKTTSSPAPIPTPHPTSYREPMVYNDGGMELIPPNKTEYIEGEFLDSTGLKANEISWILYSDGSTEITYRKEAPILKIDLLDKPLSCSDTKVTVTARIGVHGIGGIPVDRTFDIIVRPDYTYEIGEISIGKSTTNSEELAVNVDVEKLKDIDASVCIFAAAYDKNSALIGMDNTQANLDLHQESTFTFHIPTNGNTVGSVKAYIWDALDTMNPQAEAKSLDLSLSFDNITLSSKHTLPDLLFSNSKR